MKIKWIETGRNEYTALKENWLLRVVLNVNNEWWWNLDFTENNICYFAEPEQGKIPKTKRSAQMAAKKALERLMVDKSK